MFAIGFGLILLSLIFAIMWGNHGRAFNWADHEDWQAEGLRQRQEGTE